MKLTPGNATLLTLLGCIWCSNLAANAAGELDTDEIDALQRIAQYVVLMGSEIDSRVALCVDTALGQRWLLGTDTTNEVRPSDIDKLRRAVESCSAATTDAPKRLTSQLREMAERQLALAERLAKPAEQVRGCVNNSTSQEGFRICLASATGVAPRGPQWNKWQVVFERKKQF